MRVSALQFGRALAERSPRALQGTAFAAVALILREQKNELEVLLIQRAQCEGDPWSGHLAFPGGRQEPRDHSLGETARRETEEELGFDLAQVSTALGALDHYPARRVPSAAGLVIAPFVYLLHSEPKIQPNAEEVERVLWLGLSELPGGAYDTQYHFERDGSRFAMPGYRVEDRVLWGMSYQMLRSLLLLSSA